MKSSGQNTQKMNALSWKQISSRLNEYEHGVVLLFILTLKIILSEEYGNSYLMCLKREVNASRNPSVKERVR